MKKPDRRLPRLALYAIILLSGYPALALLAGNLGQVPLSAGLRSELASVAGGVILLALLRLLLRDWAKAFLIMVLFLFLFFSYGHVYQPLENQVVLGMRLFRHRTLLPLWGVLFGLETYGILRWKRIPPELLQIIAAIATVLVVLAASQLVYGEIRGRAQASLVKAQGEPAANLQSSSSSQPDIYYIILDGYTREDGLRAEYGFDNREFLNGLRQMGFVIPDCTQTNYAYTALSLSSTLHMDYLENFTPFIQKGEIDRDWIAYRDLIMHNTVRSNLEHLGYKTVAFETGYWWADVDDADYFIVGNNNPLDKWKQGHDITDFEDLYLRSTALSVALEMDANLRHKLAPAIMTVAERRYYTVRFVLDQLVDVPLIPGKKFVYAHLVAPHPPFVFSETGEYRDVEWKDQEGYAPEIRYLNGRVLEVIRQILAKSATPPVIILQGDHGWGADSRMKILNAYYLPDGQSKRIYPSITPVNSFRVIFDAYFGGSYNLLPDISYFSTEDKVYQFELTPPSCASGQ